MSKLNQGLLDGLFVPDADGQVVAPRAPLARPLVKPGGGDLVAGILGLGEELKEGIPVSEGNVPLDSGLLGLAQDAQGDLAQIWRPATAGCLPQFNPGGRSFIRPRPPPCKD